MSTKMSTTEVYVDLSKCYFGAVIGQKPIRTVWRVGRKWRNGKSKDKQLLTNMAMKGGYLWGRAIQVTFFLSWEKHETV